MRDETIFIIGEANIERENAISRLYGKFSIAFEIKAGTGEIIDADCSKTLELTRDFVRRLFIHKRIEQDEEQIEQEIRRRYYGSSVNSVVASYRDALQRFREIKAAVED